jgi:hypothetical protein
VSIYSASALVQGIEYYKSLGSKHPDSSIGLMHYNLGGYEPGDIQVVSAFDIDVRKVVKGLREALFAKPNCTKVFYDTCPIFLLRLLWGIFSMGLLNTCLITLTKGVLYLPKQNLSMLLKC